MDNQINRNQVLIGSTAILLCTGAIYAFSVFAGPLSVAKGWTMSEIMIAFALNNSIGPIPMLLGGYLTDKGWAKWSCVVGGLLFGLGFLLSAFVTTPLMLYLTYGIISGLGQGLAYSGCLSNTIKLFPDKKGFASGVITAGMGGAAIIAAPIANHIIENYDVFSAFQFLGATYIIIVLLASFFIKTAPSNSIPKGWVPQQNTNNNPLVNKNWKQIICSPFFYLIFLMLYASAFSGLMIVSSASGIGQQMFGLTSTVAALYVSVYSLSNCVGRFVWGTVSDKLGRNKALNIILVTIILAFVMLLFVPSQFGFALGIIGLGLCFGGVMGVFPPMVMENYGPANQGVNYALVFIGYSLAAFFAPKVTVDIVGSSGSYTNAFYIAIGMAVVGLLLNLIYTNLKKRIS